MNRLLSYILFLASVLSFSLSSQAQYNDGTYRFLNSTNSARVAALGGVGLPIYDNDIQLGLYNPSLINADMNNKLALSYVDYYTDANFGTVQYGRSFEKLGSFVGTIQFQNYGNFTYTSESGEEQGSFTASDYSVTLGWGRQLTDRWSIGANLKYAGLQYESYSAGVLAVDVAGSYHTDDNLCVSMMLRNAGIQLFNDIDANNSPLPFSLSAGLSKRLEHLPFTFFLVYDEIQRWSQVYDDPMQQQYDPISGELLTMRPTEKFFKNLACHLVVGGELYIGKNVVLRGSYNYGRRHDMKAPQSRALVGFACGVGVRVKMFEINYALSRLSQTGSPNYISVVVNLNEFRKSVK